VPVLCRSNLAWHTVDPCGRQRILGPIQNTTPRSSHPDHRGVHRKSQPVCTCWCRPPDKPGICHTQARIGNHAKIRIEYIEFKEKKPTEMNSDMGLKDLQKRKCGKALEKMRKTYVKICKKYAKKRKHMWKNR
jgi:hypothetical protein